MPGGTNGETNAVPRRAVNSLTSKEGFSLTAGRSEFRPRNLQTKRRSRPPGSAPRRPQHHPEKADPLRGPQHAAYFVNAAGKIESDSWGVAEWPVGSANFPLEFGTRSERPFPSRCNSRGIPSRASHFREFGHGHRPWGLRSRTARRASRPIQRASLILTVLPNFPVIPPRLELRAESFEQRACEVAAMQHVWLSALRCLRGTFRP